jgi:hypothetical protein
VKVAREAKLGLGIALVVGLIVAVLASLFLETKETLMHPTSRGMLSRWHHMVMPFGPYGSQVDPLASCWGFRWLRCLITV